MLTTDDIKLFISKPQNTDLIIRANEIRRKHELHVSGIGLDAYLDRIQGIENKDAVSLRRALGKVITKPELNKIISVQNKIFSARGGGKFYQFSNDNDKESFRNEVLINVKDGLSIEGFMKKFWKELVNIDPMGLLMAEINQEGEMNITYKSSQVLYDISFNSPVSIQYIIFQPYTDKDKPNTKYFRVIDSQFDYLFAQTGKEIRLIEEQTFINPFGYVPACFISDRLDKQSNGYTTHIEEAMIYADDMLLDYTIYKVYKVKMGIPYHWQYETECAICEGSGNVIKDDETHTCGSCGGSGYVNKSRDVADILVLPLPEQGDIPLTPPAGYVQADLQTWKQFEETIEAEKQRMYESVWGNNSTLEADRRNITASELTVREYSKENKLNEISDNEENVEKFITDLFGEFYYPSSYQGAIINNGRNYDIKTADQLLQEYLTGLEKGLPTTELSETLEAYYYSIYNRNPKKLNEAQIKMKVKPFYHWQPDKIQTANVNEIDYYKNIYFDEFYNWYELNVESFGISTVEKVQKSFDTWILKKIPDKENIQEVETQDEEDNENETITN
jgi:hypothetical protein